MRPAHLHDQSSGAGESIAAAQGHGGSADRAGQRGLIDQGVGACSDVAGLATPARLPRGRWNISSANRAAAWRAARRWPRCRFAVSQDSFRVVGDCRSRGAGFGRRLGQRALRWRGCEPCGALTSSASASATARVSERLHWRRQQSSTRRKYRASTTATPPLARPPDIERAPDHGGDAERLTGM